MREPILIVDDNPSSRRLVGLLLQRQGYEVRTAADAQEALELLKTFYPRLILMDVQLPGMSGLDLTRHLKANTGTRGVIVIAFSGCSVEEAKQKALDAGCAAYLNKPVAPDILTQLVAEYLHEDDGNTAHGPELK